MSQLQRDRMLAAVLDVIEDVGYERMSVAEIIARAGVSRRTFYDAYADCEDCVLAALEQTFAETLHCSTRACREGGSWQAGVRAALACLLATMDEDQALARLWVIEAARGGKRVLRRRAELLTDLAEMLDAGRDLAGQCELPAITAEAVVGGVFEVLHARVLRATREPFMQLLGPLMYMIVLPYLGPAAALAELSEPPPPARGERARARPKRTVLDGLKIRLTYRTARVLESILDAPGASNREVADRSGIKDDSQISKLLARLAKLGLIENQGLGQERGAANAWHLTVHGADVVHAARPAERVLM